MMKSRNKKRAVPCGSAFSFPPLLFNYILDKEVYYAQFLFISDFLQQLHNLLFNHHVSPPLVVRLYFGQHTQKFILVCKILFTL